jgi:hypothetical protein
METIYDPRELPEVSIVGPGLDEVLHIMTGAHNYVTTIEDEVNADIRGKDRWWDRRQRRWKKGF